MHARCATAPPCHFFTSPIVPRCCPLCILRISCHRGTPLFHTPTSKSGRRMMCFVDFDLKTPFAFVLFSTVAEHASRAIYQSKTSLQCYRLQTPDTCVMKVDSPKNKTANHQHKTTTKQKQHQKKTNDKTTTSQILRELTAKRKLKFSRVSQARPNPQ